MCGIAGCFGKNDTHTIKKMIKALPHRGPDDKGIFSYKNIILGHTRLSIVDIIKGRQPIITEDGNAGIVCNGEIYNYLEKRHELISDFKFTTDSDTEVILNLFLKKYTDCVYELDGMFSFAVFNKEKIMLARDPIGIKPLYYGYKNKIMYFTSELCAMTLSGIKKVYEFPPGHFYTPEAGFVKYYEIPSSEQKYFTNEKKIITMVRNTIKTAVKKRLLSDKEIHIGAFCSGGLDSSIIAAIAAEEIPNLHTFAVGMKDEQGRDSDDLLAARLVAKHIGSNHHELIFTQDEYYQALPTVINKLESYDPSLVRCAVPCYFTCKLAAEYVTVVLTGEGADELFAGYQYMKHFSSEKINIETRRCIKSLHNINLQRADRMGMFFSLELRVPFLDTTLIDLASKIPPHFKIYNDKNTNSIIEKWILRKAFEDSGYLPDNIIYRKKVQYTQGAGCESLGETLAKKEISDIEFENLKNKNPKATINSKEAAYYFKIFQKFHPQESIIDSIGIWSGFDFEEERKSLKGTIN